MVKDLIKYFKDKKVLILGFGREGYSTYKMIRRHLKEQKLYIADRRDIDINEYEGLSEDKNVEIATGENYLYNLESYDIIMKTPGLSFAGIDTSKFIDKVKSQLELILEFMKVKTIGVTGTKGKSTTSSLIYKILKDQKVDTMFLGNIGIPAFDYIENINKKTVLVLEMSSHQLEYMKCSPNISILLNLYEEHLDHYESFAKYAEAKCNIYKHQRAEDYFLYNIDNENSNKFVKDVKSNVYKVSFQNKDGSNVNIQDGYVCIDGEKVYSVDNPRKLLGDYNLNNIMFVLTVAKILKLNMKKAAKSIAEFETLPHRLEFVGKYNDILFYDNSIATIPQATIEAVKALKEVNTLIIGGMDRGINYGELIDFINQSNIENIICMPKTGHDIAERIKNKNVYKVETMEGAVEIAKQETAKEKICLLSPAAASYGFFRNFEEKGDIYKQLVKA